MINALLVGKYCLKGGGWSFTLNRLKGGKRKRDNKIGNPLKGVWKKG